MEVQWRDACNTEGTARLEEGDRLMGRGWSASYNTAGALLILSGAVLHVAAALWSLAADSNYRLGREDEDA